LEARLMQVKPDYQDKERLNKIKIKYSHLTLGCNVRFGKEISITLT
jgi:hypothetical protein